MTNLSDLGQLCWLNGDLGHKFVTIPPQKIIMEHKNGGLVRRWFSGFQFLDDFFQPLIFRGVITIHKKETNGIPIGK